MAHPIRSALETVKYWAGQRLLNSPLHPAYLKLTGHEGHPHTYQEWLLAEAQAKGPVAAIPQGYRIVLPRGARLAQDAGYWFRQAVRESEADIVYADEDVMDQAGLRSDPVFRPAWSPELFGLCDYWGGAYLIRDDLDVRSGIDALRDKKIVHIPKVLVHRASSASYSAIEMGTPAGPHPPVSVIICSRNLALVNQCLAGIEGCDAVVVDHRAGLPERPGVKIAPYNGEFNFARMCNLGARASQGDLLLFLNDDTVPLEPRWIDLLAQQASRLDVGAVGALLTYPDGRIQHAGIYVGTANGAGHPGRLSNGTPLWPWLKMTREVLAVTGACLMTRRDVFEKLGGFDESFPVNYNDVDYCLKCGAAGYKVILEARARVEHQESASRKNGIRYGERSRFLSRWADVIERGDPYWNPNLSDNELLLPAPEAVAQVKAWR